MLSSGDVLTTSYTTATLADKNVGTGKAVSVSRIAISGTDAGNYSLAVQRADISRWGERFISLLRGRPHPPIAVAAE